MNILVIIFMRDRHDSQGASTLLVLEKKGYV